MSGHMTIHHPGGGSDDYADAPHTGLLGLPTAVRPAPGSGSTAGHGGRRGEAWQSNLIFQDSVPEIL